MTPIKSRMGPQDRSQIATFSAANDFPSRLTSAFALVTDWSAAMAGNLRLEEVARVYARQVGAAHVALYRLSRADHKLMPIVAVDRSESAATTETISGALLRFALEHQPETIAAGAILRLSELREHPEFALNAAAQEWDNRREVKHISLMILEVSETKIDVMETLYDHIPDSNIDLPAPIIAGALAEAWALRSPGVILGLIGKYGVKNRLKPGHFDGHILSPNNPYALSRSQQKVCQLLAAGQKATEIAALLNISIATVRSHLSNIYAKTGTAGQFEILALLNGPTSEDDEIDPAENGPRGQPEEHRRRAV